MSALLSLVRSLVADQLKEWFMTELHFAKISFLAATTIQSTGGLTKART